MKLGGKKEDKKRGEPLFKEQKCTGKYVYLTGASDCMMFITCGKSQTSIGHKQRRHASSDEKWLVSLTYRSDFKEISVYSYLSDLKTTKYSLEE